MRGNPDVYAAITPSDATKLRGFSWLRIGGAGDLVLKGLRDSDSVTIAVADKEYVPFGSGYVMAASTATGIVGFKEGE